MVRVAVPSVLPEFTSTSIRWVPALKTCAICDCDAVPLVPQLPVTHPEPVGIGLQRSRNPKVIEGPPDAVPKVSM